MFYIYFNLISCDVKFCFNRREKVKRRKAQLAREAAQTAPEAPSNGNQQPDLTELSRDLPSGWQVYITGPLCSTSYCLLAVISLFNRQALIVIPMWFNFMPLMINYILWRLKYNPCFVWFPGLLGWILKAGLLRKYCNLRNYLDKTNKMTRFKFSKKIMCCCFV